jgi:hypothetical protein
VATTATVFTGFDSQATAESNVWKIVGTNLSFGHFYCASGKPTGGTSSTFTVRVTTFSAGTTSTVSLPGTCQVTTGNTSGVATGSWSLTAGQAIDVQVNLGNQSGGVSWGLGP